MAFTTIQRLMFFMSAVSMFAGCNIDRHGSHSIHGSGKIISRTIDVGECSGIAVKTTGSVYLTQSDNQSIRIEADDNVMGKMIAERQNGTLVVGLRDDEYSDVTVKIYVSMKQIKDISIDGAGTVECMNKITTETLDCTINGAGNIDIKGQGDRLHCSINGAGNISGKDFVTKEASAELNGAGHASVYASERFNGTVNGVGVITYYGNPGSVKSDMSGIGMISRGD